MALMQTSAPRAEKRQWKEDRERLAAFAKETLHHDTMCEPAAGTGGVGMPRSERGDSEDVPGPATGPP